MTDKKCKHCAMLIPSEAKICPYCRKKQPMQFNTRKTMIVLGIFLFLGIIGNLTNKNQRPPAQPTQEEIAAKKDFSDSIDAQVYAKEYIKQRLKAPSTAKWQDSADVAVAKIEGSKNKWLVQGYVDSQNSYGAMLRMQYWVTLRKSSNGTWSVIKLQTQP